MSNNELIVIEQANAVAVLSTDNGIKALLDNVRDNIDNMDGGSMKNKASRAKIKSNAFKATKAFTKINDETIIPLIASLTAKIQPQIDVINAVKANQSVLKGGLQQIRKDVNAEVDAFEAEIQKELDAQAWLVMLDEAESMNVSFEITRENERLMAHMEAIIDNHAFDVKKAEEIKLAEYNAERDRAEKIARETAIAERAAAEAKLKAENEAKAEKQRLIDEKEDAIKATALLEKQAADNEVKRIAQEKENKRLADETIKAAGQERIKAEELAETNRLAAIEQTKIDEANKIEAKRLDDEQEAATRKANVAHATGIKKAIIASLMVHAKLSKEDATATASALWYGKITNINVII